jgi:hypothetical protein
MGQKYRALYTRSNYADIADSSKNYFVAYNNEEGIYGFISLTTVRTVLLFLLFNVKYVVQQYTQNTMLHFIDNSQQCFIVFVERKTRSSSIHKTHCCISVAIVVTRTLYSVTSYVHCLFSHGQFKMASLVGK